MEIFLIIFLNPKLNNHEMIILIEFVFKNFILLSNWMWGSVNYYC